MWAGQYRTSALIRIACCLGFRDVNAKSGIKVLWHPSLYGCTNFSSFLRVRTEWFRITAVSLEDLHLHLPHRCFGGAYSSVFFLFMLCFFLNIGRSTHSGIPIDPLNKTLNAKAKLQAILNLKPLMNPIPIGSIVVPVWEYLIGYRIVTFWTKKGTTMEPRVKSKLTTT